ncbi:PREDICTED: uncharacterized protein LOC109587094 [Amphimedon queenslandica]|uniref:Ig-like domain-containing protein n=1 Tax=Amphimedon queenslandica TaxID=400682 RepID=A0AAN0JPD6_AMPQE|nr:PREDICTED: uncharacterized protein LOC109587094 [Amphimedon queenslandica]|eukprot:XP_019858874.1 PREDICTED: uncharacterized protein LOC109587094 [Amphimedon queenslandica]
MATVAGIYWCLVLTGCMIVSATGVLTQTSPPYSPVCPNDELVLTCVFDLTHGTEEIYWRSDNSKAFDAIFNNTVQSLGSFSVLTLINSTAIVITATSDSIPLSANGVRVGCRVSSQIEDTIINISGPPTVVSNVTIGITDDDALLVNWNADY